MPASFHIDRRLPTILLVSITVLVAVVGWIAVGFYAYNAFFWRPYVFRTGIPGDLWQGEIVFVEQSLDIRAGPIGRSRVMTFNPKTGSVRPLGMELSGSVFGAVSEGNRLWVVASQEVAVHDGTGWTRYEPQTSLTPGSPPFLLDGQLSVIMNENNVTSRLASFVDGDWRQGRRIVLPGNDRNWAFDEERNQKRLVPRTTGTGPVVGATVGIAHVLQVGSDLHVLSTDAAGGQPAYRRGFDFAPEAHESPSALVPENALADTVGWSPLDSRRFNWQAVPAIVRGEFVLASTSAPALWKLDPSNPGEFVRADPQPEVQFQSVRPVTSAGGEQYLVDTSKFQSLKAYRWTGDHFERPAHYMPGNADHLISLETSVLGLSIAVLFLSHFVLLIGAARLASRWSMNRHSFGHTAVTLAPLGRRWLARGIDLACALLPLVVVAGGIAATIPAELLVEGQGEFVAAPLQQSRFLEKKLAGTPRDLLRASVIWFGAYTVIGVLMQAFWGGTPGKRLCHLRVVRTTLRRSGLMRSLLRELLLAIDTLFLLTPIPGVVAILLSDQQQRFGDRSADTIVILANSSTSVAAPVLAAAGTADFAEASK